MRKTMIGLSAVLLGLAVASPAFAAPASLPGVADERAVTKVRPVNPGWAKPKVRPVNPGRAKREFRPVPGPVAGLGLPVLLIGAGYVLFRRRKGGRPPAETE